jgi:hypothetical protein
VLAVVAALLVEWGCRNGPLPRSCEAMRQELVALLPEASATAAWDDVVELQDVVERGLALQREIEERCEPDG